MSEGDRLLGQPFLGGYVITRKIGAGGMGAVYLAENPELGTRWAVKVLLPERSSSASAVARFKAEARAASRIRHRNIIQVQDMGQLQDGRHYITLEYLEGTTLRRYARGLGLMPVDVTLAILAQVCAGLQAAHDQGIIHRDLKPSNIFVAPQPDNPYFTKVLDFGIAKLSDRDLAGDVDTKSQTVAGTPNYMSPEQARALRDVDRRTDLYAVGVMAYELLTGRLPYKAASVGDLAYQQACKTPPRPRELRPDLPAAWDDLIWRTISLEADARPQSAHELAQEMMQATPRGVDIARTCASLLFTTMTESSSPHADPLGGLISAPPSDWSNHSLPGEDPTGSDGSPGPVSQTISVTPDSQVKAAQKGASQSAEPVAHAVAAGDLDGDFSRFGGATPDEETRADSPGARRSRSGPPRVSAAPSPSSSATPSEPWVDFSRGAGAATGSQSAPMPVGPGAEPAPAEGETPTTLGFSASEKSSPGIGRASGGRGWIWAVGIVGTAAALGVAIFFIVVRAPSGVEGSGAGAAVEEVEGGEEGEGGEGEGDGVGEGMGMGMPEPEIRPLVVEADAGGGEEEGGGDQDQDQDQDQVEDRDRDRDRDRKPKDPDELFEMRN